MKKSRRQFLRLSLAAVVLPAIGVEAPAPQSPSSQQVWLPLIYNTPRPSDAPIVGPPSGSTQQAIKWLVARATKAEYTQFDITTLVETYQRIGASVKVDWFLAIAQMAHETGSLTSWWSFRPRRNPAGIGVTGATRTEKPPTGVWQWDEQAQLWREGLAFASWEDESIPAHLGRLLAYALRDDQADTAQRALIAKALAYRPLQANYRGIAPTITGLNGRWAWPGTTYGQSIMALRDRMRAGA